MIDARLSEREIGRTELLLFAPNIRCRGGQNTTSVVSVVQLLLLMVHGCGGTHASRVEGDRAASVASVQGATVSTPLLLHEISLGVVPRGGRREFIARLANTTKVPVRWTALRTSCDCLTIVASKSGLDPGDDMLARICLNAETRAEFVGNLAVEVTALAKSGAEVLRFNVLAQVVPESEITFPHETMK